MSEHDRGTRVRNVNQRLALSKREHEMLKAISDVNEESLSEVLRRLLRDEYRYLVKEGLIHDRVQAFKRQGRSPRKRQ